VRRVFLVDDEADVTKVFKMGLEKKGFEADAFTNPNEAVDAFKPFYYDIVVFDILMPVMNGFELYKELRKQDDKFRIIFVTAGELKPKEPELQVLPSSLLNKPPTLDKLLKGIEQC
jgi:DNA-binding response OmpR family regulator